MKSLERASNQRASRRAIDVHETTTYDDDESTSTGAPIEMPPGDSFHLKYSYAGVAIVDAVEPIDEKDRDESRRFVIASRGTAGKRASFRS